MNKIQLNNYIRGICEQIPIVHSFYTNDVYECWNAEEVKYGSVSFVITDASISENTTTWTAMLYYADRLMEDGKNRDEIQTDAVNVINSLMNTIYSDDTVLTLNYPTQITLFEQKFMDYLAGGYTTLQIGTDNSVDCGYGYVSIGEGCVGKINELTQEIIRLEGELVQSAKEYEEFIKELNNNHQLIVDGLEETINEKEDEIEDLNETIEQLREGGIDFSSIGYDESENKTANESFKNELNRSKELLEYWRNWKYYNTSDYNTNGYKDIMYAPYFEFIQRRDGSVYIENLFTNCYKLTYVPLFDTSKVTSMYNVFSYCYGLTHVPLFDTSNVTDMHDMFKYCNSLTNVPCFNTSNVTNMNNMFSYCNSLTNVPCFNTSNVTDMHDMFTYSGILSIPQFDTSNVTNMKSIFYSCEDLELVPLLNTSNVTNMNGMFYNCKNLINVPQFDTSNVTDMTYFIAGCTKLESLPLLNFSSVVTMSYVFGFSNLTNLTSLGGFTGLKIDWTGYGTLKYLPNLTVQSLLNVFNTIADVNDLGGRKLEIGTTNLNKLTDEQKQIATSKGWTLS